ncbi:protein adenylyltransferase SelO [Motilimonas pumila]|uniref:Protein nucleotidyltransferase YdiU n=1 Tax=Motilimonas pumila TaxID=2303987 RepID=A0A418YI70_9GAMM|nr:protein adenylyltransferase SelO family protein [Motilimonas pumila]RJG50062.1 hypothetical protein D1Z90_04500 [Motilimonas pumila]
MPHSTKAPNKANVTHFDEFAQLADYSLMRNLCKDPDATIDGKDHRARQVFSGHYVPVTPTPIAEPQYVSHSRALFQELGLRDELVADSAFCQFFSGDASIAPSPMQPFGWATGYALSIYGTEYTQQCPFGTGNGYGDGRAISVFEGIFNGQRWEMQLKGGGTTPYCRGADGRAVLRSSVREFLAQDYMHALGVPTSRSLTLFTSASEAVTRPWYSPESQSSDPDIMQENPVAICTRVASSFLRVGQVELFGRRARSHAHLDALAELRMIVAHLIEREYAQEIDQALSFHEQIILLASSFRERLTSLVAQWIRVGFCQGNFNSDNCAAGGFTLDYGPFGFCEIFDPEFQPWTGGGQHFAFFNQPNAAHANFHMFCLALAPLLAEDPAAKQLEHIRQDFAKVMQSQLEAMWASKLGLTEFQPQLLTRLLGLMQQSEVDYTILFRELSHLPTQVSALKKSFYVTTSAALDEKWQTWLNDWQAELSQQGDLAEIASKMQQVNPKYTWREWLIVPAYQQAAQGDYRLIHELQQVLSQPYEEQSAEIEAKYYRLKPKAFYYAGGISHYSCSS